MAQEFYTTGIVDNSGKLRMPMADVNDFFRKHKGDRIVVKFMAYPKSTSDALKGYYYNYVVPTIRQALPPGSRCTSRDIFCKFYNKNYS